ncbi:ROK family protein [Microbacterium sp. ARD32]|uniref:ROK family protein n=1 Tax=Microbacterium sp. ARD32 TaxID=2962577 RepID=UPI002881F233|nr:ROK family protein [Microbacterium sp. ARD32]MDT0158235.1 ROK family protein [Microbacterium sp. ARD32]
MADRTALQNARIVGVDVGGTKVRALVADAAGRIIDDLREPTEPDVVAQIARIVRTQTGPPIVGLGVGVPGAVDPQTGCVSRIPNAPLLDGVPLAALLSTTLHIPVAVENDLAAAALAEARSATSASVLAVIAAGTGIGLGIVHDGVLLQGATGAAGEIGDIPLPTGGTLEDTVSIEGIRRAHVANGGVDAELSTILALAANDDAAALAAIDHYAEGLAFAVQVARAVLDPDRLVLTGGLAGSDVVLDALRRQLGDAMSGLTVSEHGTDAPAHGALLLGTQAAARSCGADSSSA